jgi:hypothetical protein
MKVAHAGIFSNSKLKHRQLSKNARVYSEEAAQKMKKFKQ